MPGFQPPTVAGVKRGADHIDATYDNKISRACPNRENGGSNVSFADQYWIVQWRMPQQRKHKTWDGDGVLVFNSRSGKGTLFDLEGRTLSTGKTTLTRLEVGTFLELGNKELEIDCATSRSEYLSGACFGRGAAEIVDLDVKPSHASSSTLTKKFVPLRPLALNPKRSTATVTDRYQEENAEDKLKTPGRMLDDVRPQIVVNQIKNSCWTANWRKTQQKKNKTWDGDAYVVHEGKKLTLVAENGKIMGGATWNGIPLYSGYQTFIANKVIELDSEIAPSQLPKTSSESMRKGVIDVDELDVEGEVLSNSVQKVQVLDDNSDDVPSALSKNTVTESRKFVAPTNFYARPTEQIKTVEPLHDPNAEGAIVMKTPTTAQERKFNIKNRPLVPVVIDPFLGGRLRPHQIEGVKFLYESIMGLRKHEGQGCILADEMGLGKTLQTITLIWTVLKQNPYGGGAAVGKVLIVCPVSLVNNWKKEFHKWLGKDRLGIFMGDKDVTTIKQFINSRRHQVLIIGYEKLRAVITELAYCIPPIGLIVCDEGHRLKSANNKTSAMFEALKTPRRIILSGTPIQNDLSEFHAMADFCNPGLLDDYSTFRRVYEQPILKSRTPGCSAKELELGEARSAQLQVVQKSFVLRREANILSNYLPPKYEHVLFITPTELQKKMFKRLLQPDTVNSILQGSAAHSLALITKLVKISNSPTLIKSDSGKDEIDDSEGIDDNVINEASNMIPSKDKNGNISLSGKLSFLARLLDRLRKTTDEKCVLVSHYTATLNIVEEFCKIKKYSFLRLDGQTPSVKRQEYVDIFNKTPQSQNFLFLLSAKAGGVGINLIGASRLCLIDSDWNPSHDLQSMARIHRDGQKRPVFIYRLLTTGTIDEKIYQRQVTKLGLSDSMIGSASTSDGSSKSKSDSFSPQELRNIFTLHTNTACHTHDLLGCTCLPLASEPSEFIPDDVVEEVEEGPVSGFIAASQYKPTKSVPMSDQERQKKKEQLASLSEWIHINCLQQHTEIDGDPLLDDVLKCLLSEQSTDHKVPAYIQNTLLETIDLSNITSYDINSEKTPGGLVSFVFQKKISKS